MAAWLHEIHPMTQTQREPKPHSSTGREHAIGWLLIVIFAITNFVTGSAPPGSAVLKVAPLFYVLILSVFAFAHGSRTYGARTVIIFFVMTFVISWAYETSSILTGFPFGDYFYTAKLGPKLWLVPLLIMPAYFSVCYLSWCIAKVLLGTFNRPIAKHDVVTLPLIAAFVMVMWDLSMDPARSTMAHVWIWKDGGAYFGVPIQNFAGWFLCVYTIFQVFSLYLWKFGSRPESRRDVHQMNRAHWTQPILMYGALIVEFFTKGTLAKDQVLTAENGTIWNSVDMHQSLALVSFFTMFFVTVLALVKLREHGSFSNTMCADVQAHEDPSVSTRGHRQGERT
jgi:uncharacterized membrane protein